MRFPNEISESDIILLLRDFPMRFPCESSRFLLHNWLMTNHAFEPLRYFLVRYISCFLTANLCLFGRYEIS
jgi:hypothetical protein